MLTRCPHCQTHFRVTAEQLKFRHGKVRCGTCRKVFDALESLSDEIIAVVPETPPPPPDPAIRAADESPSVPPEISTPSVPEPKPRPEPGPEAKPESESEPEPEPEAKPGGPEPEAEAKPEPTSESGSESESEPAPEPSPEAGLAAKTAQAQPEVPAVREHARRWPWLSGIITLSLLMIGQLLYFFRSELAVVSPELRPFLVAACETLGCTVPRPIRPDLVGIETSDLVPDGEALRLMATLKNRAPFAQDYPHLELTLTDTQDAALVRKVLAPADYLPAGRDAAAGFPARGEISIDLRLTTNDVTAAGYRLYLFYP